MAISLSELLDKTPLRFIVISLSLFPVFPWPGVPFIYVGANHSPLVQWPLQTSLFLYALKIYFDFYI